ncbi:hypothetical protein [Streptosporangium longisporum]|uniref:Leucine-rich repeat domain-containing protein n=1 Tax=Streptosporangium longisporum TaxID=46187 RepID=A0ABP6KED5_9ACTN
MMKAGDVAAVPLPLGGYGACQVGGVDADGWATVCTLDWYSAMIPTLEDLASAGPLVLTHHGWPKWPERPEALRVDLSVPPPPDLVWLGWMPVLPGVPQEINAYGAWESMPSSIVHQRRWDLQVPADVRAAYGDPGQGPVVVDLGDGPRTLRTTVPDLDLPPHLPRLRWPALDALPCLTALRHSGPDRGLTEALTARPLIDRLTWNDPPGTVDLSTTHLTTLTISGTGLRHLRLPPGLMDLRLTGEPPETVEAAEDGRWIELTMTSAAGTVPSGLHGVRELDLHVAGDLSPVTLGALTGLESLHLGWSRPYGRLLDAFDPGRFPRLHTLRLTDAYGIDASFLPPSAASLRRVSVDGIRRSQAGLLKTRYGGTPVHVTVQGAKSDAWLAANVDNPLRDWVDGDERGGAAACKAYASAVRAVGRLSAGDPATAAAARTILRTLVEKLNGIEERYEIIDTLRREEAADAFFDLAQRAGIPDPQAAGWFDEWRDF